MIMWTPEAGHGLDEGLAAHLEIGILVEAGAGRRQQHHRARAPVGARIAQRRLDSLLQRAADLDRQRFSEGGRELVRRLADQIGAGHMREQRAQRLDAAALAMPPAIQ